MHLGRIGLVVAVLGFLGSVVYFLQPWNTCPTGASTIACAMLPGDRVVMTLFLGALAVGVLAMLTSVVLRGVRSTRSTSGPID